MDTICGSHRRTLNISHINDPKAVYLERASVNHAANHARNFCGMGTKAPEDKTRISNIKTSLIFMDEPISNPNN